MSVVGLLEAEKIAERMSQRLDSSYNKQLRELRTELQKTRLLLADRDQLLIWRNNPAGAERINQLLEMLNEAEKLYLSAGNTQAARIFKERMGKQLQTRLTNLKANEIEVRLRSEIHRQMTENELLSGLTTIKREGAARELYAQSRAMGGYISGVGRGFMQDLVTLETKTAGSKTIGRYMKDLYDKYENGLKDVFVRGIVRGDSYEKMEENLMRITDITKGKARILVRTEANAIFNESVREVIDDNPLVKGYRFRAVLDRKTSTQCQQKDGTYIPKDEVKPGVNFPPLHPNCRSTVTTVLVNEKIKHDAVQRYTKNKSNEWVPVPPGMTYPQFKERMQEFQEQRATPSPTDIGLAVDTPEARVLYNEITRNNLYPVDSLKQNRVVKNLELRNKEADKKYGLTHEIRTPERQELRDKIEKEFLNYGSAVKKQNGEYSFNGEVKKEFKLKLVTGLPASGKSTIVVNPDSEALNAFIFDSDVVKENIPEFKESRGSAANATHKESQMILESAKAKFLNGGERHGDNLIIPVVGSNKEGLENKWIEPFEEAGYDVEIKYRPADTTQSVNRVIARTIKEGRGIPLKTLFGYGDKPEKVFESFKGQLNKRGNKYVR